MHLACDVHVNSNVAECIYVIGCEGYANGDQLYLDIHDLALFDIICVCMRLRVCLCVCVCVRCCLLFCSV